MDDAFATFYRDTRSRLIRYAYGLTGDGAEAQDLVQEAYARAWQRRGRLRGYEDVEGWLRLVVTRLATDRWRRLGVRRTADAAAAPPDPVPPPAEDTVLLVRALRTLPVNQRRALVLYYLVDRSVAEIALETEASVGTVKSWLARGRAALAAQLTELTGTDEPPAERAGAEVTPLDGDCGPVDLAQTTPDAGGSRA